jgi:hypothetical protein
MTDSTDYRKYLENEFGHIRSELAEIKIQVTQTNGTVREHTKAISELKVRDELHIVECPAMPKLNDIEKDLTEYHFFKQNPKLTITIIAVFTIGIIISAIVTVKTLSNNILMKQVRQQTETTNQILAPEAAKRGFNLDSLGLND